LLFVKPWEEQQTFEEFIDSVSQQGIRAGSSAASAENEVRYAQTRESVVMAHGYPIASAQRLKVIF
jgi:hypothetical protein